MKHYIKRGLVLVWIVITIPAVGLINYKPQTDTLNEKQNATPSSQSVKINYNNEIKEVSLTEYLKGTLCAEMPSSFETEAKKAQVIAAHTYAINRYGAEGIYPTDPSVFQAYIDKDKRFQIYKDNFEETENKLENIVNQVKDKIVVYEDQPIVAAFFSMSGGKTENCAQVFGKNLPYLTATDSVSETQLPNFISEIQIDNQTLKSCLEDNINGLKFDGNPNEQISINSRDPSDYVECLNIKDKQISGAKLRNILNLPSADFSIEKKEDGLLFICKGKGHGVGMSQYGANELAKEGKTYQEILTYYYKGTAVKSLNV